MSNEKKLAIIGYSGHAYVCIEAALLLNYNIIGYHDVREVIENPFNLPFLKGEAKFKEHSAYLFISIGDNKIRQNIYNNLKDYNTDRFITLQHPTALVSPTAKIGTCVLISAAAIINAKSFIGCGSIINTGAIIEHECYIQDFVHVAPGAVLAGKVSVGQRSFIGAGAVVKQGISIGKDVTVGAGAVVVNDLPDNIIVVGNPAKRLLK